MRAVRIIVSGHVQGVGFRAFTQQRASLLNLTGWVRNLSDGSVEIHAEGDDDKVNEFLTWCRIGPRTARVDDVTAEDTRPEGFSDFKRR
ncbi:MAG: acylphosphatase [Candidatus Dadabacteria bacterium]|nr:acylphosphatase [Candidatus Dadabacteria bacterium]